MTSLIVAFLVSLSIAVVCGWLLARRPAGQVEDGSAEAPSMRATLERRVRDGSGLEF